ncbi:MAG: hypothetical protein R3E08_11075 [Thiotrichaceae bacterium]
MRMLNRHLTKLVIFALFSLQLPVYAESVKFVQWWDQYLAMMSNVTGAYRGTQVMSSTQQLDLDNDGVNNDARVWYDFSLDVPFNPGAPCQTDSKNWHWYRSDRPSGRFYGGLVARYTNVSDIMRPDDPEIPLFNKIQQATVQQDGANPGLYSPDYPNNTVRGRGYNNDIWSDMTVMVVNPGWGNFSQTFMDTATAQTNFAAVFLWKKADFVNGGASAAKITFDTTSKLTVDLTRHRKNVEEGRFVVQDGQQLWISEFAINVAATSDTLGATVELNPSDSLWATYAPAQAEIDFDIKQAKFEQHTFKDVQAAGIYFASYRFAHEPTMIVYDNFQVYATTDATQDPAIEPNPIGLAVNKAGEFIPTAARFSRGIAINGGMVSLKPTDPIDIRGVITVDSSHVGQAADILTLVAYQTTPMEPLIFFMFDEKGAYHQWDGQFSSLVAMQKVEKLDPEVRVNLFPMEIDVLQNDTKFNNEVILGCNSRPLNYTGIVGFPGIFKFYYGYRLKDGTIAFNRDSIDIEIKE